MFIVNKLQGVAFMKLLALILAATFLSGCNQVQYDPQGDVDTLGDAMSHCRAYTKAVLPQGTRIALDELSSRETREYYEIFFDVSDANQTGYAKCRVDKYGLITYHGTRDFRTRSKSFSGF